VIQEKFYLNPFAITYKREAAATATVRRRRLPTMFVTGPRRMVWRKRGARTDGGAAVAAAVNRIVGGGVAYGNN